ncbi:MAG: hypothetical protein AAF404_09915 [Pseudomonadota bacterium]
MFRKQSGFFPVLLVSAMIAGCGGSDGGGISGGSSTSNTGNSGGGDSTGESAAFFNDQQGFSFANTVGGRLSSLFAKAFTVLSDTTDTTDTGRRQVLAQQTSNFPCTGSGDMGLTYAFDDATFALQYIELGFTNCVEDGDTTNGSIVISGSVFTSADGSGDLVVGLNDLAVTGDDPVSMNGTVLATAAATGDETTITISGDSLTMVAAGEAISFTDYTMTAISNESTGGTTVGLNATVDSSIDGQVDVVIDPPFSRDDDQDAPPLTGIMVMTHVDGSSLTIDADTGDPETFHYTVDEDGTVTTGVGRWDETDLDFS